MAEQKNKKVIIAIIVVVLAVTIGFAAWLMINASSRLQ